MADSLPIQALSAARAAEWRPGLADGATPHGEIFASSREAGGAAVLSVSKTVQVDVLDFP